MSHYKSGFWSKGNPGCLEDITDYWDTYKPVQRVAMTHQKEQRFYLKKG